MFLMLALGFALGLLYLFFSCTTIMCHTADRILKLRYDIKTDGLEKLDKSKTYLFIPNHQAVIDPIILFSELYDFKICPFVDESYTKAPIIKDILAKFNTIAVPDVQQNRKNLEKANALEDIARNNLSLHKNLMIYPSGHITLNGKEEIAAKSLVYKLCKNLPENVEVIGIRTTGLWGSTFSRYGRKSTPGIFPSIIKGLVSGKLFTKKRKVSIELITLSEDIKKWVKKDKLSFNRHLETFYNK